jgi:phosphate transport system substrate-binding protein
VPSGNTDLTVEVDPTAKASGAYPVVGLTFLVVCAPRTTALLKAFLEYVSSAAGQGELAALGYAPLPDALRARVAAAVKDLSS